MKAIAAAVMLALACWSAEAGAQEILHRTAEDIETSLWRSTANLMFYLVQTRGDIDKDALADYQSVVSKFEEQLSHLEDVSTPEIRDTISALKIDWELVKQSADKLVAARDTLAAQPGTLFDDFWDHLAAASKDVKSLIDTTAGSQ